MNLDTEKTLNNLGVLRTITETLLVNGIDQSWENLKRTGFGFEMITESFDAMIVLSEEVSKFLLYIREKQETELLEQSFAFFGKVALDRAGKPMIYFDRYIEDGDSTKKEMSCLRGDSFMKKINEFVNDHEQINKVLLMGHTHPDFEKMISVRTLEDDNSTISNPFFALKGNPLKLRKRGYNISLSDADGLISGQAAVKEACIFLTGVSLPNGEFNILMSVADTILSLDDVRMIKGDNFEPIPNFKSNIGGPITF